MLAFGATLIPAAGLAIRGVSRSRFEGGDETGAVALSTPRPMNDSLTPFRSRLRAQLWLEWRTHGRGQLLMTCMLAFVFIPIVAMGEYVRQTTPVVIEYLIIQSYPGLDPAWLPLLWFLGIPPLLAGASGGETGRFSRSQKTIGVPAFVGLMPISTRDLLCGKFIASALHLALMWAVLLTLALAWVVFGGLFGDMAARMSAVCGSPALAWLTLLAALAVAYAITYAIHIGSMWLGLFGPTSIASVPAFAGILQVILVVWAWCLWEPGYGQALWTGLWVALAAKSLLAAYLLRHDLTRLRVGAGLLGAGVLAWAAFTVALASLAWWLAGDTAALAVVVLSPLASWLATPAVLHRSRHGAWA